MAMEIRRPDFNWETMMDWWSAHSDGSHIPMSDEEILQHKKAYNGSIHAGVCDVVQRVHEIGSFFTPNDDDESSDDDERVHQKEIVRPFETSDYGVAMLVQLQNLAEYVDITKELHSGNFLATFFQTVLSHKYKAGIYNKHAAVRAKAAEVVATMVEGNPTNQQLVMEANGLQHLLDNFISDPDVTARTKALAAIYSLILRNKPGITAFRKENCGYATLGDALNSESARFQWEALNLIHYLLHENSSDCNRVTQLGFPCIMMHLTSSDHADVRETALRCLILLARDESSQLVEKDDKLKQVLQERIKVFSAMSREDIGAANSEIQLVDALWNACYNEPSSLREKGLPVIW